MYSRNIYKVNVRRDNMCDAAGRWWARAGFGVAQIPFSRPLWEDVYAGWKQYRPSRTNGWILDSARMIMSAINHRASTDSIDIMSCDQLYEWLLKNWGDPKNKQYHRDRFFDGTDNPNTKFAKLSGEYGVMMVFGKQTYATLWEYDKMLYGEEYLDGESKVYFWVLEAYYETVIEDRLRRVPPDEDMDKVAIAGFNIINKESRSMRKEMGATIYQSRKTNLFSIGGFCVGTDEYVNKKAGFKRLEAIGVDKSEHKAFIHTHIRGPVAFSGIDLGAAFLSKKPIYMKLVSDNRVFKAPSLVISDYVNFTNYLIVDKEHEMLVFPDEIARSGFGIDSCNARDNSGEKCLSENRNLCSVVKKGLNFCYCQYGIFMVHGQEVNVV